VFAVHGREIRSMRPIGDSRGRMPWMQWKVEGRDGTPPAVLASRYSVGTVCSNMAMEGHPLNACYYYH
jgi:hypothetical protein